MGNMQVTALGKLDLERAQREDPRHSQPPDRRDKSIVRVIQIRALVRGFGQHPNFNWARGAPVSLTGPHLLFGVIRYHLTPR
jgi:hypothetical protein